MACSFLPNTTIASSIEWWQVADTLIDIASCGESYLRPSVGGALQPWVFSALLIALHIPIMALRVARWEDVQTLSIILAGFNVALAFQACLSTRLAPEDVLVWGPSLMTLVIDAGAMEQFLTLGRKNFTIWWADLCKGAKPAEEDGEFLQISFASYP
jgi:hypothetical protein